MKQSIAVFLRQFGLLFALFDETYINFAKLIKPRNSLGMISVFCSEEATKIKEGLFLGDHCTAKVNSLICASHQRSK